MTQTFISRRNVLGIFAATAVCAAPTYANAFGFLRGAGDIRRFKMYSRKSQEYADVIYWIDGEYIADALQEINWIMRDLRAGEAISIDTRTVDIIAASQKLLETDEPFTLLSGYRTTRTNALLRSRSKGVARNSLHIKGQAADIRMKGRNTKQVANAARTCASGGVGRYARSNFVHVDCGQQRTWRG